GKTSSASPPRPGQAPLPSRPKRNNAAPRRVGIGMPENEIVSATADAPSEAHRHQHRDVSGGWLRPAVFGAMDGLVTNVSVIGGVGGGGGTHQFIVLTGLAGLAAGAFSMAIGEFVSVSSQNELVEAEVRKEAHELKYNPESERQELAATFRMRGVDP